MRDIYIERELTVSEDGKERSVAEADILSIGLPLVILGDPGLGKTKLTESIATRIGGRCIPAGAFIRNANLKLLKPDSGLPIIIDGLDELTASSSASSVDEVLKKLSAVGYPLFILSCRAADWSGSADRQKILEDYGTSPTTLRLEPFSRADAKRFLSAHGGIDADQLIDELDRRDLDEFYINPLTLNLVAEIAADKQGLPDGRADLLLRASRILTRESNPFHQRGEGGMADPDSLLDSAGAIFAHLLLSGSLGVADRPWDSIPPGFVPSGDLAGIPGAPLTSSALKSRLFRSNEENLFVPYHRVIAEFLAARWLAKRLDAGLSERRAVQGLVFAGGVPTALRGLHAWLGHFVPRLTEVCIRTDPYGALRYGDPGRLSLPHARLLLQSLADLADEDPYFRGEDWGRHTIAGLARPELKPEFLELLRRPDRHLHLSTIILESLQGSSLTAEIVPQLLALVTDENAIYVERRCAAEALLRSRIAIDWATVLGELSATDRASNKRLALEVLGDLDPNTLDSNYIADALLAYHDVLSEKHDKHIYGSDYLLIKKLSPAHSGEVLDHVVARIAAHQRGRHWRMGDDMGRATYRLICSAIGGPPLSPARLWRWLRLTEDEGNIFADARAKIAIFLKGDNDLRRAIQRFAFSDPAVDGAPWMTIVHDLPRCSLGLAVLPEDFVVFLDEITALEALTNFDVQLWTSLLRANAGFEGVPPKVEQAVRRGIDRHPELQRHWDELTAPPEFDWRREEQSRQAKRERERQRRFRKRRKIFAARREEIAKGQDVGALWELAYAYLNRYHDLHEDGPLARLKEWVGDDLAQAALQGFVNCLSRPDLPTAKQISDTHAEGKVFNSESVLICGVAELIRTGRALNAAPREVLKAALAASWESPELNEAKLGVDVGKQLEAEVFSSDEEMVEFLTTVMEPGIAAGREHIPNLYELSRDARYGRVAGQLALGWLESYPDATPTVQRELLETVFRLVSRDQVQALVREHTATSKTDESPLRSLWMGASFLMDFENNKDELRTFCQADSAHLWALSDVIRSERGERWQPLSIPQLEFIVGQFAEKWPPVPLPSGSWGNENPWDAADFIRTAIRSIGADSGQAASEALDRLRACAGTTKYHDEIKHIRAQQLRLRRDTEFLVPTFAEVKSTLSAGLPTTIDDLKALTLDALETIQVYLRQGDTTAWSAFWSSDLPRNENTCRDRLVDLLRGQIPKSIAALPEARMPDAKRSDVALIYNGMGLPVEIKGQWHKEVWNAPSEQLIDLYSKDYRANGRGIYLVFWCGRVPRKNVVAHPDGKPGPKTATELQQMLSDRLDQSERFRVNIVVLDISPT